MENEGDDDGGFTTGERLWILNQRIRQTRFDQLTKYYKMWVIAAEALLTGIGIVWLIGVAIPPYSISALISQTSAIANVAIGGLVAMTLFLRVIWTVVTGKFPEVGRTEDWEI